MAPRIIFEGLRPERLQSLFALGYGAELLYSFVIITCSLMIYFGTKELYELTQHKGIKYFRLTFLFFAWAYFVRSFIKFVLIYSNISRIIDFSPLGLFASGLVIQVVFVYLSSMSLCYLLYSLISKKVEKSRIWIAHLISAILALLSISLNGVLVFLLLNLFILSIVIAVIYISSKDRNNKRKSGMRFVYTLLSLFWILNIVDALIPEFFQGLQFFIYLASIGVFLTILYKVLKRTGAN
jgi:hypothetical protein